MLGKHHFVRQTTEGSDIHFFPLSNKKFNVFQHFKGVG